MSSKAIKLTAKQQIHTLSAKKKKSKKTFRCVLAQPFPRYWPQLSEKLSKELFELLLNIRQKRPEWFTNERTNTNANNKTFYCGLQASIRKLKSAHIKLLVLSADLKPKYVTNQIIIQALANNQDIRILCITNMTNFTQTLLNFSCYAFVVGHEHWSEMPELDLWTAKIVDENFPLPLLIKKHFPKRPETNSNTAMEVDEQCQMTKEKGTKIDPNNIVCDGDLKDLHLIRDNCDVDQRVFVPKNGINLKPIVLEIESLNKIKSDFVSLETYSNSNDATSTFDFKSIKGCEKNAKKKGKRPLALYRELTIHKIQNNPNKMKKPNDRKNKKKNKQK